MGYKSLVIQAHFVYPSGKLMRPHLLRCQGLAVDDYGFVGDPKLSLN